MVDMESQLPIDSRGKPNTYTRQKMGGEQTSKSTFTQQPAPALDESISRNKLVGESSYKGQMYQALLQQTRVPFTNKGRDSYVSAHASSGVDAISHSIAIGLPLCEVLQA